MYFDGASDNKVVHVMEPAAWLWEPLLPEIPTKEQIE
jgi:hypothetical protein